METALNELLAEFSARWNAHDAEGFGALFTADAAFTDVVGRTATGPAGIAEQHRYPFTHVQKNAVVQNNQVLWRPLTPGIVVGTVYWTATGSQTPAGQPLPPRNGVMQWVVCQQQDQWKIASVLNSDLARGPYAAQQNPVVL